MTAVARVTTVEDLSDPRLDPFTALTDADLCAILGANYGDLDAGTYTPVVTLPK